MEKRFLELKAFEWDRWNTDKIREKHHVEPYECEEIFFNELIYFADTVHSQVEQRYHTLGITNAGRLLFVVFTIRTEKIRVISARNMHKKERKIFYEEIKENTKI